MLEHFTLIQSEPAIHKYVLRGFVNYVTLLNLRKSPRQ